MGGLYTDTARSNIRALGLRRRWGSKFRSLTLNDGATGDTSILPVVEDDTSSLNLIRGLLAGVDSTLSTLRIDLRGIPRLL